MEEGKIEPPLTEPLISKCLYCTGAAVDKIAHAVQIVFWLNTPDLGGETEERRITARIALPIDAARNLSRSLAQALKNAGHH